MSFNIWKVISIILIIVLIFLSFSYVSKVSYSAGYEDGKSGIIKLMQTQYKTGNQIITLGNERLNSQMKELVYFLNTWNYKK